MSQHEIIPENYQLETSRWSAGRNSLFFVALVSVVLCVFGYTQNPFDGRRFSKSG